MMAFLDAVHAFIRSDDMGRVEPANSASDGRQRGNDEIEALSNARQIENRLY